MFFNLSFLEKIHFLKKHIRIVFALSSRQRYSMRNAMLRDVWHNPIWKAPFSSRFHTKVFKNLPSRPFSKTCVFVARKRRLRVIFMIPTNTVPLRCLCLRLLKCSYFILFRGQMNKISLNQTNVTVKLWYQQFMIFLNRKRQLTIAPRAN